MLRTSQALEGMMRGKDKAIVELQKKASEGPDGWAAGCSKERPEPRSG